MRAFTLVELLVVVSVIAILAAIAIPNFLEAQMRSKVSRAKADMATIRTALECYAVDNNSYPLNAGGLGLPASLLKLTRPKAYISAIPNDPFMPEVNYLYLAGGKATNIQEEKFGSYVVASVGPDRELDTTLATTIVYDPTNGTVSKGDIAMTHKSSEPREAR